MQIPTSLLKMAREKADINQTQLASALKVSPSVISRLESAEYTDAKMAERYLSAVGTGLANDVYEYYQHTWRSMERPPFDHPERSVLWTVEEALQNLAEFISSPEFDPILLDPVTKLTNRLINDSEFLRITDHGIAFVGDIGVGKTTALSFIANLTTRGRSDAPISVFPTGSGRTTVCEVAIKVAPAYGIAVDCLAEEEIRRLVFDLVNGLKTGKGGLPSELERVIRNMAGLPRVAKRSRKLDEKTVTIDPLKDMMTNDEDIDLVIADVIARMRLEGRAQSHVIMPEPGDDYTAWLATNISKINYGQHPTFSVPQRITVLLPSNALRETPYSLTIVDTKGVEGSTQRPDLKAQIDDPRTIAVLCTKFPDAPGNTPISIMKEIVESGSDALETERVCLLILPRDTEAVNIIDDTGWTPTTFEDGYAIREVQVDQQLATEGLPSVPMNFYNIGSDDPLEIWTWLSSMIGRVRQNKVSRVQRLVAAAEDLITNSDVAKTRQARRAIDETIRRVAERIKEIPPVIRPAHLNLVAEAKKVHQSSIAASITRRGDWEKFHVNHILGVGAQIDANKRTATSFTRIDEQLVSLKEKYCYLLDIKQFLQSLLDDVLEWRQEFLSRVALTGRVTFAGHLRGAHDLWQACEQRYGQGSGYRVDVSDIFLQHFEEDEGARSASQRLDGSIVRIWREVIVEKLVDAVAFEEE